MERNFLIHLRVQAVPPERQPGQPPYPSLAHTNAPARITPAPCAGAR
jgi:hypothetical protein